MLAFSNLAEASASRFAGAAGAEHFISVEADPALDFAGQLDSLQERYAKAQAGLGLSPGTAVFRRIFLSDALNQIDQLRGACFAGDNAEGPVAVSIIQQAPLSGAKVAMLAYHVSGGGAARKQRLSRRHILVERNGSRHLWSTRLCADGADTQPDVDLQTRAVFGELNDVLARNGANLADHCVRTWLYVKDVDIFYMDMVRSRAALFDAAGLTEDTHYIASTGIQGACAHAYDIVAMDAYSNLDLVPGQMTYLNDLERLCLTKDYKVTFERGTKVAYADRSHLFISGTASIDAAGQVVHVGDVMAQLDRTLGNIEALLRAGGAELSDLTHMIVYLRDPSDHARVRARLKDRFGGLPMVIVEGSVCRPDWLIEIEGSAVAANADAGAPAF